MLLKGVKRNQLRTHLFPPRPGHLTHLLPLPASAQSRRGSSGQRASPSQDMEGGRWAWKMNCGFAKRHRHVTKAKKRMGARFICFFNCLPFKIFPGENVSRVRYIFTGFHAPSWRSRRGRRGLCYYQTVHQQRRTSISSGLC